MRSKSSAGLILAIIFTIGRTRLKAQIGQSKSFQKFFVTKSFCQKMTLRGTLTLWVTFPRVFLRLFSLGASTRRSSGRFIGFFGTVCGFFRNLFTLFFTFLLSSDCFPFFFRFLIIFLLPATESELKNCVQNLNLFWYQKIKFLR